MKKYFFLTAAVFCFTLMLGLGVDVEELKTDSKIEFNNYRGTISDSLSLEEVIGIGQALSRSLKSGITEGRFAEKYAVFHVYNSDSPEKLGADILVISEKVKILHINFIQTLLTGFYMEQYGFADKQARILAVFTTYYNAVHRLDLPYITERYQSGVLDYLDATNAGLSLNYSEWAGKSRIIIPLTDKIGSQDISLLDTSVLSETKVIEELKKAPDRGITEREQLVTIKEEELATDKAQVTEEKKTVEADKKAAVETASSVEADKKALADKKAELDAKRDTMTPAEVAQKEADIKKQQEDIAAKEQKTEAQKADITARETQIKEDEKRIAAKEQEVQADKAAIATDKKVIEAQKEPEKVVDELQKTEKELKDTKENLVKSETALADKLYYLRVKEYLTDGHYNNDLYIIDAATGKIIKKAGNINISGHEYFVTEQGILVITFDKDKKGNFLTLLDPNTLEIRAVSAEKVFHRSFIQIRGGFIYAIVWDGATSYNLGKFNSQTLQVTAKSATLIDPNTVFHLYKGKIYVNTVDKKIVVLKESDLTEEMRLVLD